MFHLDLNANKPSCLTGRLYHMGFFISEPTIR